MYRGFKIEQVLSTSEIERYHDAGLELFKEYKDIVFKQFKDFVFKGNEVDATGLEANFFPQKEAHVFISHSHTNEREVVALAGLLKEKFGIVSFVDSYLWQSAKELQKEIDNVHSWFDPAKDTYSYSKVAYSASHVHMMLSVALSKMIDRTECILFYKTPESLQSYKDVDKTTSPWIYSEITTTQIVRKMAPKRLKDTDIRYFSLRGVINEGLKFRYKVELNHLAFISKTNFDLWTNKSNTPHGALDNLYKLIPLRELKFIG